MISKRESATRAEIIWCLKNVASNMSAASTQGIVDVFKAMFGTLPTDFSLSPTKLSYIISEALGPYCRNMFVQDLRENYFSLQYDETTNNKDLKELQICLRFYSEKEKKIVVKHLETFFLGNAKAETLKEYIVNSLNNAGLHLKKLLMLGSDGPNVNIKVSRLVNEEIKALNRKPLIDIGTCSIHLVHNAFLKGLQAFGSHASEYNFHTYIIFLMDGH